MMLILTLVAALQAAQGGKLPVPDEATRKPVEAQIAALYKGEFAAKDRGARTALARKLLTQSEASVADPNERYVLLVQARDVAADVADVATAFVAITKLDALYEIAAVPAMKRAVLEKARKGAKTPDESLLLAEAYMETAREAVEREDCETASESAKQAATLARAGKDADLAKEAGDFSKEIDEFKKLVEDAKRAELQLSVEPSDAKASVTYGKHLCLVRGDWTRGLPILAQGSDAGMKKIAERELAAAAEPKAQAELADAWEAASRKETAKRLRSLAQDRALHWYETALPGLSGVDKLRAQQKMAALYASSTTAGLRITYVADQSMKVFPVGYQTGNFPKQETDDPTGPFSGKAVYFMQTTGKTAVYQIRTGRRYRQFYWKGAAMVGLTFEILDVAGQVVTTNGPHGGGNTWGEFTFDLPPLRAFTLRITNQVSVWLLIAQMELR